MGRRNGHPPKLVHPWPGAVLKRDPSAACLANTGDDMVIERRVGRGRIVVTAFRITGPDFTSWEGCDSFFNACLMRRPARKFDQGEQTDEVRIDWLKNSEEHATFGLKNAADRPDPDTLAALLTTPAPRRRRPTEKSNDRWRLNAGS